MMQLSKSDSACYECNKPRRPPPWNPKDSPPIRNDVDVHNKSKSKKAQQAHNTSRCIDLMAEKEMRSKYRYLQQQYSKVCNQEALLRNHIALLSAELALMQTNAYHRTPADVKKITIDPVDIRKVDRKISQQDLKVLQRPSFVRRQMSLENQNGTRRLPRMLSRTYSKYSESQRSDSSEAKNNKMTQTEDNGDKSCHGCPGCCSYFCFPPPVVRPPLVVIVRSTAPDRHVTSHRLKKLKLPQIVPEKDNNSKEACNS